MDKVVIAIDGPAGAGKSTIAKIIADRLNILYIDTGAMYRAVTLNIINEKIEINDSCSLKKLLDNIDIKLSGNTVYLNGMDVTSEIRTHEVTNLVSPVSAIPEVREKLIHLQRNMALNNDVVMDGRDIGTNVLKDASLKIFLTASISERTNRRFHEMQAKGLDVDYNTVYNEILVRDKIDSERKINPLKKAEDAIVVDTTGKSIDDVVNEILNLIKTR